MKRVSALTVLLIGTASSLVIGAAVSAAAPVGGRPVGLLADPNIAVATAAVSKAVSFDVFLPLRNEAGLDTLIKQQQDPTSASYHKWLTPSQFAQTYGPSAGSMIAARQALIGAGFSVDATHSRSLSVSGSVANINRAFATSLRTAAFRDGHTQLVAPTALTLPAALQAQGAVIAAFSNAPNKHVNSQKVAVGTPANRASDHGSYYFTDLRQAYDYPALNATMSNGKRLDGTGTNVAIIMSSDALDTDVADAFNHEKFTAIAGRPAPKIIHVAVDGGCTGGVNCDAFDEASLDTQQVLGGAPGARVTLLNIPDLSDQSTLAAYEQVVESNQYDLVSMSYGGCELFNTAAYNGGVDESGQLKATSGIFKQGTVQGITWVASSGDSGGLGCPSTSLVTGAGPVTFVAGVEAPAVDPNVVGVGGGNLVTNYAPPSLDSAYVGENANGDPEIPYDPGYGVTISGGYWGAGGGLSTVFSQPSYQTTSVTGSSMRTVPDIGMQVGGCPGGIAKTPCGPERSSVVVWLNGVPGGLIGTSVAAPEFAGALALYVQRHGRQGNLNTFLYSQGAAQTANSALGYYHRTIPGFDGKYSNIFPANGYDYLVGNGTPDVRRLFGFTDLPAAGVPQTATNP